MYYQFKVNGYTIQDLVVLCRITAKRYRRGRTLLFRGIVLVLGLVMLGMGALILAAEGSTVLGTALILLSLLYLALSVFYYRLTAWRSSRMQIKDVGEITVTLDDAGVREQSKKARAFTPTPALSAASTAGSGTSSSWTKSTPSFCPRPP